MTIKGMHHVAIPMPVGQEEKARNFYETLLHLVEIRKPAELAKQGGVWFLLPDSRHLHLQVEPLFQAQQRAHPAFLVEDLDLLSSRLEEAGHTLRWDERWEGVRRFFVTDPFGNRLEFIDGKTLTL
ncbi:MAG: VOC family protein [Fimbriimonadaceae bacterium]|nr:VOC family protein [Fimbriimonadaceae bacterium]